MQNFSPKNLIGLPTVFINPITLYFCFEVVSNFFLIFIAVWNKPPHNRLYFPFCVSMLSMRLLLKTHQATFSANITTYNIVLALPVLRISTTFSPVDVQCTAYIHDTYSMKKMETAVLLWQSNQLKLKSVQQSLLSKQALFYLIRFTMCKHTTP